MWEWKCYPGATPDRAVSLDVSSRPSEQRGIQCCPPWQGLSEGLTLMLPFRGAQGTSLMWSPPWTARPSHLISLPLWAYQGSLVAQWLKKKNPPTNAGGAGSIPRSERSPWSKRFCKEGSGNPLQCLAWKVSWSEEPSGLYSMGSQKSGTLLSDSAKTEPVKFSANLRWSHQPPFSIPRARIFFQSTFSCSESVTHYIFCLLLVVFGLLVGWFCV